MRVPKMNAKGKHESIRTFRLSWNRRRERRKREEKERNFISPWDRVSSGIR
jgi:tRNA G37 N-methylase TrmD